jgi:hypothetical protein
MAKQVKILDSPDLIQKPRVDFRGSEFDAVTWTKGIDVVIESSVECPCKSTNNDNLSICQNCRGTKWVFINSTQDRAILSSINFSTEYKDWSVEKVGTINVTLQRRGYLSYMDKIIVKDSQVIQSEVIYPKVFNSNFFSYTIYDITSVVEIFQFVTPTEKLALLVEGIDYTVERNKVLLTINPTADIASLKAITGYSANNKVLMSSTGEAFNFSSASVEIPDDIKVIKPDDVTLPAAGRWIRTDDLAISIRYWHELQYYVLDTPHTIRNSYKKNSQGRDELQLLPIHGIARLSHYVVDSLNFTGDNIFDNSYQTE